MFNIGSGELALIAVAALLILGPKRLPELARGIGKFMREFRRQTDEVRSVVEREFYKMDQELPREAPTFPSTAPDAVAQEHEAALPDPTHAPEGTPLPPPAQPEAALQEGQLPPVTEAVRSQVTGGMPSAEAPVEPASALGEKH